MLKKSDYEKRPLPNKNPVYINGLLLSEELDKARNLFVADIKEEFPEEGVITSLYLATEEYGGNGCLYRWCNIDHRYKSLISDYSTEEIENLSKKVEENSKLIDEFGNTISKVTESITTIEHKITPEALETTMSSKFVTQTKFEELEIGGRNLLYRTNQGVYGWSTIETNGSYNIEGKTFLEQNGVRISCQEESSGYAAILRILPEGTYNNLRPNGNYVITIDTDGKDIELSNIMCSDSTKGLISTKRKIAFVTEYGLRIRYYIKLNSAGEYPVYSNQYIHFTNPLHTNESVTIVNLKLEEGTKSTGWTPAPEDVYEDLDGTKKVVTEKMSKFEQTIEGFNTTVSETKTEISDVKKEMSKTNPYVHIKYSMNKDGNPFYNNPSDMGDDPVYMGVNYSNTSIAPTDPKDYTWVKIIGAQGIPGNDGKTSYIHFKYSNDGKTFTGNDGEDIGAYLGTCVDESPTDPLIFDRYTWKKIEGDPGEDGVGIKSTTVTYQSSTSGTDIPTGEWESTIPSVSPGSYLWTKITTNYSNDTSSDSYSVCRMGIDGNDGTDAIIYAISWINTEVPSGSWTVTLYKNGVVCTDTTYISLIYSRTTTGEPEFSDTKSGSSFTGTFTWTSTDAYKYLVKVYSDSDMSNLLCTALLSPGLKGDKGVGVESVTRYYLLQSSSIETRPEKPTTYPPTGWSDTEPTYTSGYKLYTVDLITYSDGNKEYSTVSLSSSYDAASSAIDKVDNLNIGGRNLALGTKDGKVGTCSIISYPISAYGYNKIPDNSVILSFNAEAEEGKTVVVDTYITDSVGMVSSPLTTVTIDDKYKRYTQILKVNPVLVLNEEDLLLLNIRFNTDVSGGSGNTGLTLSVDNIKLEIGNKVTDWTQAPEDDESYMNDKALDAIKEAVDNVNDILHKDYVNNNEYSLFKKEYETTVKQTAEMLQINASSITNINNVIEKVETYFDFKTLGLIIGKSNSKVVSVSTPEGLFFIDPKNIDGENIDLSKAIAKYSISGLETSNIYSNNQVGITDSWVIRPGATISGVGKNLNVMWIGG